MSFLKKLFGSWQKILLLVVVLIIAYYPLAALFSEKMDRSYGQKFEALTGEQSQGIEVMAYLVDREVNEHLWVSNLPYFFPASCLDNMPNFQKGIFDVLADVARVLPQQVNFEKESNYVDNIANLLDYPSDVWILAKDSSFKMAPSSTRKYRKALKLLRRLNADLKDKDAFLNKDANSLGLFVDALDKILKKSAKKIDEELREGTNNWFDSQADDVFYFSMGQIYACLLLLEKFGIDYKNVLTEVDVYQEWTTAIKNLQMASKIAPKIVVNGNLSDALRANHLVYLGYYIAKVRNILRDIKQNIEGKNKNENRI